MKYCVKCCFVEFCIALFLGLFLQLAYHPLSPTLSSFLSLGASEGHDNHVIWLRGTARDLELDTQAEVRFSRRG